MSSARPLGRLATHLASGPASIARAAPATLRCSLTTATNPVTRLRTHTPTRLPILSYTPCRSFFSDTDPPQPTTKTPASSANSPQNNDPHKYTYEEVLEIVKNQADAESQNKTDYPEEKTYIIDVRETAEVKETGKIPRALQVPIVTYPDSFHIDAHTFFARIGRPRPHPLTSRLIFYCKAGVRSHAAAKLALAAGWKDVGEYPGSWLEWSQQKGPVEFLDPRTSKT